MAKDGGIENLFKEYSFEEIESIRDNLACEIEKRTELLKSIVKEKYRDIVETSDAIQSMKSNLKGLEQSLWSLDKSVSEFYIKLKEPTITSSKINPTTDENFAAGQVPANAIFAGIDTNINEDIIKRLLKYSAEIWEHFDSGNLRMSVKLLNESTQLLKENQSSLSHSHKNVIDNLSITFDRTKEMVKNSLWYRIQSAAPDQIGIIAGSDQSDLYQLSLVSSIEFLVDALRKDLFDTSFHAQMRRYQPFSYFDIKTNQIDPNVNESKTSSSSYVQIPRYISPELNLFLYNVCKVINTITGFNLNRSSIVESLDITISKVIEVYSSTIPLLNQLKAETKRKRALQLYFDLLYVRILLNTSKNVDLIERLDPRITELTSQFEPLLDTIELYTISAAMHSNVIKLSHTTIRLFGLLIPHLK